MTIRFFLLIYLLAVIVIIISIGDILLPTLYLRETAGWKAQGIAQDLFDLFIAAPILIVSAMIFQNGSKRAFFVLAGTLVFLIYTFIIFAFAVHFNSFFLLYCAGLGLSCYSLIYLLWKTGSATIKQWFTLARPLKAARIYLWFFSGLFLLLWLSEIVPATIKGTIPENLLTTGLLTNPVHVIDLSFLLPGFALIAILLKKDHPLGYLFAPIIMTFSALMTLSIATLIVHEYMQGLSGQYYIAIIMTGFACLSILLFRSTTASLKNK